jgi:hypothetical protein
MEPVETPTTNGDPPHIQRRWRIFLLIEFLLMFVALFLFLEPHHFRWVGWAFGAIGAWLGFTLPIAFLYLIGKPPVMSLSPFIDSAEARAYRRELKARPEIDDHTFFERFYSNTSIPRDIPIRVRRLCVEQVDPLFSRVQPTDKCWLLVEELDISPVLRILEQEFQVTLTAEICATIDTFDSLVQYIAGDSNTSERNA